VLHTKNITLPELRSRCTRWRSCFMHCNPGSLKFLEPSGPVIGLYRD